MDSFQIGRGLIVLIFIMVDAYLKCPHLGARLVNPDGRLGQAL